MLEIISVTLFRRISTKLNVTNIKFSRCFQYFINIWQSVFLKILEIKDIMVEFLKYSTLAHGVKRRNRFVEILASILF